MELPGWITPVYRGMCPNCGGPIGADRLAEGLPCRSCLPRASPGSVEEVAEQLRSRGALRGYGWLYMLEAEYRRFEEYFVSKVGMRPWSAQRSWARRLLMGDSMAIIAPTGVGKSTLLSVYTGFRVEGRGWRVLYLSPTENLVRQTASRIESILGQGVAYYYSSMGRRAREEALARIEEGRFSVAVVTTGFLQRRFQALEPHSPFNLVIVDDVDSILRNSRNIDRVLTLMGIPEDVVETAYKLVDAKLKLYSALASGREHVVERIKGRIVEYEALLRSFTPKAFSQLVIASATGRPRGVKHLVFKELLGFEVGGGTDYMRNVVDTYTITGDPYSEVLGLVRRLGPGGIVFVSQVYGKPHARIVAERLARDGVRVAQAVTSSRRAVEKMAGGEVDVIVGVASRYGVLVRGLDLPERVRYAIFLGIPGSRVRAQEALLSPRRLLRLLLYMSDEGVEWAGESARRIKDLLDKVPDPRLVGLAVRGRIEADGPLGELAEEVRSSASRAYSWLEAMLGGSIVVGSIVYERGPDGVYAVVPDAPTYIQASGRTSRLHRGVMTLGLSVIVETVEDRIRALGERLSWYTSSTLKPLGEVDLGDVMARVEETRRGKGRRVNVKSILLIVESPTKARTISWFWGRPSKRVDGRGRIYETAVMDEESGTVYLMSITASRGHMFDLAIDEEGSVYGVHTGGSTFRPVYDTIKRCTSCGYTFAGRGPCPRCGSTSLLDSSTSISRLRKLALEVDEVVIATDPDREGEKIAWDIYLALKPYNSNIWRAKFHEVTRTAVFEALRGKTRIDENQVTAQMVRRIADRWIGFSLSNHLWLKYGKRWLGAGRVQTPVLGWVVDRYKEWRDTRGYRVVITIENGWRIRLFTRDREKAKEAAATSQVTVSSVSRIEEERSPPPPYTTDTLVYEASARLRLSANTVMKLAQDLFESGLITYHRTDSTRVSPTGMAIAKQYLDSRGLGGLYTGRPWGEGGAHEAIRPTRPLDAVDLEKAILDGTIKAPIKLTRLHIMLYDMIFRRFIASQMSKARVRVSRVTWEVAGELVEDTMVSRLLEPGFYTVYPVEVAEWAEDLGPGHTLRVASSKVYRSSLVSLYRSGDLVRLMKEHGIGRPSTYASAIEANRRHGYVIESKRMKYIVPTKTGIEVYNYLVENFRDLVTVETSRRLEEELDLVEAAPEAGFRILASLLDRVTGIMEHGATGESVGVEA